MEIERPGKPGVMVRVTNPRPVVKYNPQDDPVAVKAAEAAILKGASVPAALRSVGIRLSRLRPDVGRRLATAAMKARQMVEDRMFEHALMPAEGDKNTRGDWRATLAWLQSHPSAKADWSQQLDVRKLDDTTLLRLIAEIQKEGQVQGTAEAIDAEFEAEQEPGDEEEWQASELGCGQALDSVD